MRNTVQYNYLDNNIFWSTWNSFQLIWFIILNLTHTIRAVQMFQFTPVSIIIQQNFTVCFLILSSSSSSLQEKREKELIQLTAIATLAFCQLAVIDTLIYNLDITEFGSYKDLPQQKRTKKTFMTTISYIIEYSSIMNDDYSAESKGRETED